MDLFALTRKLIDIESITGNETAVGEALADELQQLGYNVERMPVERHRFNLWATWPGEPHPAVVLSTHMDVVPPFFPSSETDDRIYGRGSCDAKGIIAAQIGAAEKLKHSGIHVGLLFLVGEERDSQGAQVANQQPRGSKFLINGEPTENKLALASKGTLRVELEAKGKMAHSAYPELGESAIEKLLDALDRVRALPLPTHPTSGPCTMNIGLIEGGRAPNVIPDHAVAHLLFRLVGPAEGATPTNQRCGSRQGASALQTRDSLHRDGNCPRDRDHDRCIHYRYSRSDQLGTAVADRPGLDSRRPHRRRVHREEAVAGSGGAVCKNRAWVNGTDIACHPERCRTPMSLSLPTAAGPILCLFPV